MKFRSVIFGTTVLVVLLSAGVAQSLSGSNTIFSDDIKDGEVHGADINANAVTGAKVKNDTLTGSDIKESTLALKKVYFARVLVDGTLKDGDATASDRPSAHDGGGTGENRTYYSVDFPVRVDRCAVTATPGLTSASGQIFTSHSTYVINNRTDGRIFVVIRNSASSVDIDSFSVIVVCP
jgi:hypothetical protein